MNEELEERVLIRKAVPTDAQSIAQTHVSSWRSTYPGIVPQQYLDALDAEQFAARWLSRLCDEPSMVVHVAEQRGSVCGFAAAGGARQTIPGFSGELYAIYLPQSAQRRKIGSSLFWSVVGALVTSGFDSMFLWTLALNPSRGFYERMSGEPVGEEQIEIGGAMLTQVAYGWRDLKESLRRSSLPS